MYPPARLSISLAIAISCAALVSSPSHGAPLATDRPNEIVQMDLRLRENTLKHKTSQYKQMYSTNEAIGASIVLRRGEPFGFAVTLRERYRLGVDQFRFEFSFGPEPRLDKNTLIYMPLADLETPPAEDNKWLARLMNPPDKLNATNKLAIQIELPSNVAVGIWKLKISTKTRGSRNVRTYTVPESVYILFNAWNSHDDTYLPRDDARQEYLMNEMGKIYKGTYTAQQGQKWNYGQFHAMVLPALMHLLDQTRLDVQGRADVVRVSRAVSALVNSHDDNGLLVGNWSGSYGAGNTAPYHWTGSAAIFEKYVLNGFRPVKFGQCWVFGGITTTAMRTLGIPARTISNFVSAHDTDLSLTVDEFYAENGAKLSGINGDSIWNFHCWTDAWMKRRDLPDGFGGWQAIDATPQEVSEGSYKLGPASLEAIKRGKVTYAYDVAFVYSEVNADVIQWRVDPRSPFGWRRTKVTTNHMGRKMLTKRMGRLDERTWGGLDDAEDITNQYKFPEGSREERQSFAEATRSGGLNAILD